MFTVILDRRPNKDNCKFVDMSRTRALQRASSLSSLHGNCDIEYDPRTQTYTIFAGSWYKPRA
jgi:hypothetical protein